ncbi:MAG TPA: OsmC family protein [Chryseosolibacter sp.]
MESTITWVSARIGNDQYKTDIITDTHTFLADEPIDNGGKDLAPSPGDFLRTSLASCTAITLRMYANRKKFQIENIEVKVGMERQEGKTIFHRKIILTGAIDEAQRKRMLQIANACPVHKILVNPIEIQTDMA